MANCSSCGISIPDGQSICSICYGDIDHGSDGYYREMIEEDMRQQEHEQEKEQEQEHRR